jgi:hypothetical protein
VVNPGEACTVAGLTCPALNEVVHMCQPAVQQCTCENGVWGHCVFDGPPEGCPVPACPNGNELTPNAPCNLPPMTRCDEFVTGTACGLSIDQRLPCYCIDNAWNCAPPQPPPDCPDAYVLPDVYVAPGCPPPPEVLQGLACSAAGQECPGNPTFCDGAVFYDALQCNGSFWITLAATQCADAGPEVDADVDAEDAGVLEASIGSD